MNEDISRYVKNYFKDYAVTAELNELMEELAANLEEKYTDLAAEGMNQKAAFETAVSGIGAPEEFVRFLDKIPPALPAPDINEEFIRNEIENGIPSIDTLNINMRSIGVVIKNHPGNEIKAEIIQRIKGFPIRAKIIFERQGNTLTIKQKPWDWQLLFIGFNDYLEVSLPQNFNNTLNITSGGGNISAEDLNLKNFTIENISGNVMLSDLKGMFDIKVASGNIKVNEISGTGGISCTSGNISIYNINCGGDKGSGCMINCVSGNINIENYSGHVNAETMSGNIKIPKFAGSGRLKVTSGSIRTGMRAITGDCDFSSSSGSVSVTAEGLRNFTVEASCGSGIIKTNLKDSVDKKKRQLSAVIGENPVNKMRLRTGSGVMEFNLYNNI